MEKIDFKKLDNKSKIEIAVTSIMIIVFIIILSNSLKIVLGPRHPVSEPQPLMISADVSQPSPASVATTAVAAAEADRVRDAYAEMARLPWGRNPFVPAKAFLKQEQSDVEFRLEGIIWDEAQPNAIINGEIVKKGDMVGNAKVVHIGKTEVILSDEDNNYKLQLF